MDGLAISAVRILFSKLANASTDEALRLIEVTGAGEVSATGDIVTVGEGRWRPGT